MKRLRMMALAAAVTLTPMMTFAQQRGPETQKQSPGQDNPDLNPASPPGKQGPTGGGTYGSSDKDSTHANPKTKQKLHKSHPKTNQNLKEHGGSHNQGTPDQTNPPQE